MKNRGIKIIGAVIIIICVVIVSVFFLYPREQIKTIQPFWLSYHTNFYYFHNFTKNSCEVENFTYIEMKGLKTINFGDGNGVWNVTQEGISSTLGYINIDTISNNMIKHQVIYFGECLE